MTCNPRKNKQDQSSPNVPFNKNSDDIQSKAEVY